MAHLVKGLVAKPEFDSWTHGGRRVLVSCPLTSIHLHTWTHTNHCYLIAQCNYGLKRLNYKANSQEMFHKISQLFGTGRMAKRLRPVTVLTVAQNWLQALSQVVHNCPVNPNLLDSKSTFTQLHSSTCRQTHIYHIIFLKAYTL